jgi:hypothetical protein
MSGIYCITVQDSLIFRCVTPGTLLQYASTGRITKSAEEPTCVGGVCSDTPAGSVLKVEMACD